MRLPSEVQERIDLLSTYDVNDELEQFDIFHIYSTGEYCYPDGYYDAQWFRVVAYNTVNKQKREFKRQFDGMSFYESAIPVYHIRVYVDGSTLVKMRCLVKFDGRYQDSSVENIAAFNFNN